MKLFGYIRIGLIALNYHKKTIKIASPSPIEYKIYNSINYRFIYKLNN